MAELASIKSTVIFVNANPDGPASFVTRIFSNARQVPAKTTAFAQMELTILLATAVQGSKESYVR